MPLFLRPESPQKAPGQTYYSDPPAGGGWLRSTGIHVPPQVDFRGGIVNVLIWLHGYYVKGIEQFFAGDSSQVREQVNAANRNVILIVPYLGDGEMDRKQSTYDLSFIQGRWGETFLRQVLDALAVGHMPDGYIPPWKRKDLSLLGPAQASAMAPALRLGKLIIGCHSGGGQAMRALVGALGRYQANLAECWGFDCLYGANASPDDASFWYRWVRADDRRSLYVSFAASTAAQSIKLYLLGQGWIAESGMRRLPEGTEQGNLRVWLGGVPEAKLNIDNLIGLNDLLRVSASKPGDADQLGSHFADQAGTNLVKNVHWPAGKMLDVHYAVARDGLFARLKNANFL
jgi:hypothetical protein